MRTRRSAAKAAVTEPAALKGKKRSQKRSVDTGRAPGRRQSGTAQPPIADTQPARKSAKRRRAGVGEVVEEQSLNTVRAAGPAEEATTPADVAAVAELAPELRGPAGEPEDSADDQPEEVTLAAGRTEAAAQRAGEREGRAQQRLAAKQRGRRRAALAEANKEAKAAKTSAAAKETGAAPAAALAEEQEEAADLLPDHVIAAVVQRSREAETAAARGADAHQSAADAQPKQKAQRRRKADSSEPKQVGPAYVQVLSRLPRAKPSEAALRFRQGRMQGPGVKRSSEMLVPTSANYFGPAVAFV